MNHTTHAAGASSLNQLAFSATVHCLTGCSIGEVLGMVIGTALGWQLADSRTRSGVGLCLRLPPMRATWSTRVKTAPRSSLSSRARIWLNSTALFRAHRGEAARNTLM